MPDAATQKKWDTEDQAFEGVLTRFATSQTKFENDVASASPEELGKAQKKLVRHYESMVGRYKHYEKLFRDRGEPAEIAKADGLRSKLSSELEPRATNYKRDTEATREK